MAIDHYDFNVSVLCAIDKVASEDMFDNMTNHELISELHTLYWDECSEIGETYKEIKIAVLNRVLYNRNLAIIFHGKGDVEEVYINGRNSLKDYRPDIGYVCDDYTYNLHLEEIEDLFNTQVA